MKSLEGPGSRPSSTLTSCVTHDSHLTALGLSFPISKVRGLDQMISKDVPATAVFDSELF